MPASTLTVVQPARRVRGRVQVPGDKSISHRYALLAALAEGTTHIVGFAPGADCASTLRCLAALGAPFVRHGTGTSADEAATAVEIRGCGLRGLHRAAGPLDAENSGTTLRLLAGILAAHPFESVLTGDASLRRRPMRRIIDPLERMGARVTAADGCPPLHIDGGPLAGIDYALPIASAQVKSAILLAGLQASGETVVRESLVTRDHTERALEAFGATVETSPGVVRLRGGQRLHAGRFRVPGDLSSAAFWAAAAAGLPGSDVQLVDVGLNASRTALLAVLQRFGAHVEIIRESLDAGEPRGVIRIRAGDRREIAVVPDEVPGLIDELPVLAALGALGSGITVAGASELRAKESDRIAALVSGLRALGSEVVERPDGFTVRAGGRLTGGTADAVGDHRLAMAFAIAGLGAEGPTSIQGAEAVQVSYPEFFETLDAIRE
jgi:3-phosphoshikimate 1-carboxyvinyltransferase